MPRKNPYSRKERPTKGTGHSKEAIQNISHFGGVIAGSSGVVLGVKNLGDLMAYQQEQNNRDNR